MATFKVRIGSSDGAILVRKTRGNNAEEVSRQLVQDGYYVFSVTRVLDMTSLFGLGGKVPPKPFLLFNKAFRGLVRAGLPIVEGLDILLGRMKEGRLKTILLQVREKLTKGESLSEAFGAFAGAIPRYYPALLLAGEQSGNLAEVLDRFIQQEERIRRTRKKFLQTLTYPAILLVVGMIAMYIILSRAMPEFAALYAGNNRQLPAVTQFVIALSDWLVAYHRLVLGGLIAAAIALHFYLKTEKGNAAGDRVLGRLPILGPLWQLQNLNIFARTMRMLIGGGIPAPQALAITAGAVPSRVFSAELGRAHTDLVQGDSFQDALERHARLPHIAGELVRVGEATGTLGDMFEHLAEYGEERAEDYLELVSNLVAPLVLLAVGLIIAFLVAAMYLPMFGSYSALTF